MKRKAKEKKSRENGSLIDLKVGDVLAML